MPTIKLLGDRKRRRPASPRKPGTDKKRAFRQKVYQDPRYYRLRDRRRKEHPCCEVCERFGITEYGEHVHHWRTFVVEDPELSRELAFDYENLVHLCRRHHDALHVGLLRGCLSMEDVEERVGELLKEGVDLRDIRKRRKP